MKQHFVILSLMLLSRFKKTRWDFFYFAMSTNMMLSLALSCDPNWIPARQKGEKVFAKNLNFMIFLDASFDFSVFSRFKDSHQQIMKYFRLSSEPHRVLTSDFLNGFSIAFVLLRTKDSDALIIESSISLSHNIFLQKNFS